MEQYFTLDGLSLVMLTLMGFIACIVGLFGRRYMAGDSRQGRFFVLLALLVASQVVLFTALDPWVFWAAMVTGNALLVLLMAHNHRWPQARASAWLTAKTLAFGGVCTAIGFAFTSPIWLLLGAMAQSASWPLNRWLLSSLNSPTPVSALMHAGLVNGGGFMLVRFSDWITPSHDLMLLIFAVGFISAMMGSFFKLLQTDVKRMLACSTMGQMGFMLAQCGMGLFGAALTHLCWHGVFKAYLFLASGGAAREKKVDIRPHVNTMSTVLGFICGALGATFFASLLIHDMRFDDTSLFLWVIAFIASAHIGIQVLSLTSWKYFPLALLWVLILSGIYAFSINLVDKQILSLDLYQPQPLEPLHWVALAILIGGWLGVLFHTTGQLSPRLYMWLIRRSQPHPQTITTTRCQYEHT